MGTAAAQFPAFYRQYLGYLEGRLDQARLQVRRLSDSAAGQGLTLEAYVAHFATHGDPVVRAEGVVMTASLADRARLATAVAELSGAATLARPSAFAANFFPGAARATWTGYGPAVVLSLEGLGYAALGALAGAWLILAIGHLGGRLGAYLVARLGRAGRAGTIKADP